MTLRYIPHTHNDQTTYLKVRAIVETQVIQTNECSRAFGSTGDEIQECLRGIQHMIDTHPRLNTGYLGSYLRYETTRDSIKVYHSVKHKETLICEVMKEKPI